MFGEDLFAVVPEGDMAFLRVAGEMDVHGDIVPHAGTGALGRAPVGAVGAGGLKAERLAVDIKTYLLLPGVAGLPVTQLVLGE